MSNSGKMVKGKRERFILKAESEEERNLWLRALREEASRFLPLHDFFSKLRKSSRKGSQSLVMPQPLAEGWMKKRSSNLVTWNRRLLPFLS